MAGHQALKWNDIEGTNLELFEERLEAISKNHSVQSSLTQKFRQDIRNRSEYLDFATVMRVAIILMKVTRDIKFVLNSEGKGSANLLAKVKGQTILFVVSRIDDVVGLDSRSIVSKLQAVAEMMTDTGDPVVLSLESQAVGYALNFMQSTLQEKLNEAKLPYDVAAVILFYPETLSFAGPKGTLSRDLGILLTVSSSRHPLSPRFLRMLYRMLRIPVGFNGQGVEGKKKHETILEAIGAAGYGFLSFQAFAAAYDMVPTLSAASPTLRVFSWIFSAALFVGVFFRRTWATYTALSYYDFRLVRTLQDAPKLFFEFFAILGVLVVISVIPGSPVSIFRKGVPLGAGVASVTGGFMLCIALYVVTRLYSSAGFARVYLLKFLRDQGTSNQWLLAAALSLNKRFADFGLRFDPYDFRAGVSLGLMRAQISLSDLSDLAENVVSDSRAGKSIVIDRVEKVLRQINQGPSIFSLRPLRSRLSADKLTVILSAVPPVITLILILLRLMFGTPIPF
jgi:hypothetical protein